MTFLTKNDIISNGDENVFCDKCGYARKGVEL